MEFDADIVNEIISQIIETVCNSLKPMDDDIVKAEEAMNDIIFDEAMKIVSEIIENVMDAVETTNEIVLNVCEDEITEIIEQIVELAYGAVEVVTMDEQPDVVLETDEIIVKSKSESHSTSDVDLESDVSFVVECIDCIDTNYSQQRESPLLKEEDVQTNEPHESDDSIVVDGIEICKNVDVIPSESLTDEPVNQISGNDGIEQPVDNTSTSITNSSVCEPTSANDEFYYSDEVLQRKGYITKFVGCIKTVVNLALPSDALNKCKVRCSGLPNNVKDNELIPMLEKCGRISDVKFAGNAIGVVTVTYMTKQDCDRAIQMLNGRNVHGKSIKVEMVKEVMEKTKCRLFVKPISIDARKPELFSYFNKTTRGLIQVYLLYADEIHNRGYCYLNYQDYDSANEARGIISKMQYNGQRIFCEWAENQPIDGMDRLYRFSLPNVSNRRVTSVESSTSPHKLYMNQLFPDLKASDLRNIFSIYGEVIEVDKSDRWASIRFRYPDDAKRALQNVDRKKLGSDNVEISSSELQENIVKTPMKSTSSACPGPTNIISRPNIGSNHRHYGDARVGEHTAHRQSTMTPRIGSTVHYGKCQNSSDSSINPSKRCIQDAMSTTIPTVGISERSGSQRKVGLNTANRKGYQTSKERRDNTTTLKMSSSEHGGNDSRQDTTPFGDKADRMFFLD